MNYFLLFYEVVDGYVVKRERFRESHLALLDDAYERGDLLLAGAYGDPPTGAALIFRVHSAARVEAFVAADPYVINGLIVRWKIEPWHVAVGEGATR